METTAQMSFEDITTARSPKEVDGELAAQWGLLAKAESRVASSIQTILGAAGAKYYYRGKHRVTDMTLEEALPKVQAKLDEHGHGYTLMGSYTIRSYDDDGVIAELAARKAAVAAIRDAIVRLNDEYTGWSRFFLVTSSSGHIHSSMHCSTCNPRTTFGWLPTLSGETEAEAVAEHGSTLCSVCFPSAPVDWVGGKITKAQAEKKAAK